MFWKLITCCCIPPYCEYDQSINENENKQQEYTLLNDSMVDK
jgi:hypothetical protein